MAQISIYLDPEKPQERELLIAMLEKQGLTVAPDDKNVVTYEDPDDAKAAVMALDELNYFPNQSDGPTEPDPNHYL